MKKIFLIIYILLSASLLYYLALPNREFPDPPPDAVQSEEPGDSEATDVRRAYFTDYSREETIEHYIKQFEYLPVVRLNYPPEEAQAIIRDQTRSVFLEELTHPLRESIYINGFQPREAKDEIWYKGVHYNTKLTIRYQTSSLLLRISVYTLLLILLPIIANEFLELVSKLK